MDFRKWMTEDVTQGYVPSFIYPTYSSILITFFFTIYEVDFLKNVTKGKCRYPNRWFDKNNINYIYFKNIYVIATFNITPIT